MRYLALVGLVEVVVLAGCMAPGGRPRRGIPSDPAAALDADGGGVGDPDAGAGSTADPGGPGSPGSDAGAPGSDVGAPGAEADAGAAPAVDVPASATDEQRAAALTLVSWSLRSACEGLAAAPVYLATALGTGWSEVRVYGTLTQTSATTFSYDSSPADRLVIIDSAGARSEVVYRRFRGDFRVTFDRFFDQPHDVDLSVSNSDGTRFTLRSVWNGDDGEAILTGALPFDISLHYMHSSRTTSVPELTLVTLDEIETIAGTLAIDGVLVDIAQAHERHTRSSAGTFTSTSVDRFDDVWTLESGTHSLSGRVSSEDGIVLASGTLTLGATRLGTFRVTHGADGETVVVGHPSGELRIW